MSTQINVTVGGGGLVDQARRNQEEARWKLTERERWERSQRVEATVSGDAVLGGGRAGFQFRPDEPAANRRTSGPAIGYSQLLSTEKTEGDFSVGLTFTWVCQVYSGDGTASVDVEHSSTAPGHGWAGGVGAPGYTPLCNNYSDTSINYFGTPQTGYMHRMQTGAQYDGDLGIAFPPSDPAIFSPNVDPEGRRYVSVTLITEGRRRGVYTGKDAVYVFPVGNGTNLVVTHYSRGWSIIETRLSKETFYKYTGLPAPYLQFGVHGNWLLQGVSHSEGLDSSVRCVLTSKSTAREIPTPAAFKERLDEVTGTTYNTEPKGGLRYANWGRFFHPETGQIATPPGGTYDNNYPIHSFPTPEMLDGFQGEVQRSHGIQQLLDGVSDYRIIGGSPSTFYYLSVTDPENGYAEQNEVGPAAWDAVLRDATGKVPRIAVPTTENAPYEVKMYTGALPVERYDNISPDAPGIGRRISTFTPVITVEAPPYTEGESSSVYLLRTTDWGEPAYCRQQLLALGFTPADLTP